MKRAALLISVLAVACSAAPPPRQGSPKTDVVTADDFGRLTAGMTYREACAVIGHAGKEVSRSRSGDIETVLYTWTGPDGGSLSALFVSPGDGGLPKLTSKSGTGLK